ncbi:acyl-CoA dehydrogenase [Desulfosporosinus youngiae]|uniref:Acyl-CoA dehydrogenase n=1 Tax=Desulfosporosinus youngiae DSM 17734 TaxID=768710 RepID=H5Y3B0_9FIRM|nr:acyl-CoA dehydrogenase [Desulfosporosinus youngiae]EHQ88879.1 acyl-CoA dehydrogenase [Desulfosporosinus youngiae DSM 17734]
MASNFLYSSQDHKFIIKEWLKGERILGLDRFKDYLSVDDVEQILDQALKVCKDVVAPTNDDGDQIGTIFSEGKVVVPESFHHAYKFFQENGWGSSNKDVKGEGALPGILFGAVREYLIGANPSLETYIGLTGGITAVIQEYGSKEQVELFTDKMFRGVWSATMALTESGGGSDVGDMLSKAYPTEEPSIYKIKGTKCFISAGDHNLTENIIHLVLARVDGAARGTKGLSLFIVPKIWVNPDGSLGETNDVATVGIEHKLGYKGCATAVLSFGEEGRCRGLLLGEAPDAKGIGQGMAQMFKMINESRINTGQSAMAVATVAYNNAVAYARERVQGRKFTNPKSGRVPIIQHEDIRRMLLTQKSVLEAMRAMIFKGHYYMDQITFGQDESEVREANRRIEIITPLIKAYCSDQAWSLIADAIQVYGGYGYTEEYPAARQARDSKIYSIWEGTNYIQSMDLVGRKWKLDGGHIFQEWFAELEEFIRENKHNHEFVREFEILSQAVQAYRELLNVVQGYFLSKPGFVPLYSTRVLRVTAELYAGCLLIEQALVAEHNLHKSSANQNFYTGKIYSARFYVRNVVPDVMATLQVIKEGDNSALDIPEDAF